MGINKEDKISQGYESNVIEDATHNQKIDYDPTHFLRCHSKKNDCSDVQTQVWQCAFEPDVVDRRKTTSLVATCGGNSVCFINVKTGIIPLKYYPKDSRELFYALAWTVNNNNTFLVSAGTQYAVHFIHPATGIAFFVEVVKNFAKKKVGKRRYINSLLFHPKHWNLLLCGGSHGEIHICHIGNPFPPMYQVDFRILQSISTKTEIFSMTYCPFNNVLLAGCDDGLLGWEFPDDIIHSTESIEFEAIRFILPTRESGSSQDLVDSVEAVDDGIVATKCALHGAIYLWSLTDTLKSGANNIKPTHVLRWSDTDNYFMFIGVQAEANLLCCGDDKGGLWLYDLGALGQPEPGSHLTVQPACVLPWPHLTDPYTEKKRKLSIDSYDIVVDKVALSSDRNNIVAVTNNNMVCIWEKI